MHLVTQTNQWSTDRKLRNPVDTEAPKQDCLMPTLSAKESNGRFVSSSAVQMRVQSTDEGWGLEGTVIQFSVNASLYVGKCVFPSVCVHIYWMLYVSLPLSKWDQNYINVQYVCVCVGVHMYYVILMEMYPKATVTGVMGIIMGCHCVSQWLPCGAASISLWLTASC